MEDQNQTSRNRSEVDEYISEGFESGGDLRVFMEDVVKDNEVVQIPIDKTALASMVEQAHSKFEQSKPAKLRKLVSRQATFSCTDGDVTVKAEMFGGEGSDVHTDITMIAAGNEARIGNDPTQTVKQTVREKKRELDL